MWGNPDADIMRDRVQLLREWIEQGLLTVFIKIKAHRGDPLNELADGWADEKRQSENIRRSLLTNRLIFSWTENGTTHRSLMNPTVKKRIDLQVARQQVKTPMGSTANFLIREDNSRDLLGKFHKDRSVWIRATRRVLQCRGSGRFRRPPASGITVYEAWGSSAANRYGIGSLGVQFGKRASKRWHQFSTSTR